MTTFALTICGSAFILIALAIIVFLPAMRDDNIRDRRIDEAARMPPAPREWHSPQMSEFHRRANAARKWYEGEAQRERK